jgi:hypothetical protein
MSKEDAPVVGLGMKVRSGFQNSGVAIERSRLEPKQLAAEARSELKNRKVHAVTVKKDEVEAREPEHALQLRLKTTEIGSSARESDWV